MIMLMRALPWLRFAVVAAALLSPLVLPSSVSAQAWLPAKGEGAVSFVFSDVTADNHFTGSGESLDRGHMRWDSMLLDVTYGLTERVTVSFALPYVAAKYNGNFPHQLPDRPTIDTGAYHSTFQDVRFDVRYNAFKGPLIITPFLGTSVPSHDYQYFAHSAVGRDVREVQLGAYLGRRIESVVPAGFIQGRYSYGFQERILNTSHNRSNIDLEVGSFISPAVRVFGMSSGQITHGGLDLPNPLLVPILSVLTQDQFLHHDQIGRENFLNVGGGAGVSLSESIDLFGSVVHTVAGRNMHQIRLGASFGMTYSFKRGAVPALQTESRVNPLIKCACQKKTS